MIARANPFPALLPLAAAFAIAACSPSTDGEDAVAGETLVTGAAEGSGAMVAQLRNACLSQVEQFNLSATVSDQVCTCASERARESLDVADLVSGDATAMRDIITLCANDYLGSQDEETRTQTS